MKNVPGRSDAGQAAPLLAAVMAVVAVLLLALGQLGQRVVSAARARTAADAAALAGAAAGRAAAAAMAADNGGTLVSYSDTGGDVLVTVRVDGASATARAAMVADDTPGPRGRRGPGPSRPVTEG
jgi:hypothetical protein